MNLEHTSAIAAETKASSGSFAVCGAYLSRPVFPNLFHPRTISRFYAVLAYHLHKLLALKAVKKFPHLL